VKKSNSSGLLFRTAAKPPAPVNSFCRSQSVLGPHWASSARALCIRTTTTTTTTNTNTTTSLAVTTTYRHLYRPSTPTLSL
jgi:hypothetical protein